MRHSPQIRRYLLAATVAATLAARPVLAATTLVLQRGAATPTTMYADGDHLRLANLVAGGVTGVIMDVPSKKLVMLNDGDKTYMEITEEEMKRLKGKMVAMRAQMAERLKQLPPDQRKKAEAMMGSDAGKTIDWKFQALGQKKTVNGMTCDMYRVLADGAPHEEDCILPWSSSLLKKSDFTGLEKLSQTMSESVGMGQNGSLPLFHKYPGLPISRVPLQADGTRGEEEQVKSIKQGPVPAGTFKVPADYKKKPLPAAIGGP
jgi:hypothetical protein